MKTKRSTPPQATLEMRRPDDDRPPLPEGWVWTTLGKIRVDKSSSITPKKAPEQTYELYSVPSFDERKPEIVKGKDIGSSKRIVEEKTVLLCKINPRINRVWVVTDYTSYPKIASTEWIPFFRIDGVDPEYLCYFMQQHAFRDFLSLRASGVGGSLMRVKPATFVDYLFPLAPLPEQHRIVEAIETQFTRLDAAVAALHRVKANLARYKASVLKAACEGRLVPTEAALHHARADDADNGVSRRGEAFPQSPVTANGAANAHASGHPRPGGECLAPSTASHIGGRGEGEATLQPPMTAMGNRNAEIPGQEEPGGGCLAPTDAGTDAAADYEPADVLLRRILTERRARWMADNPGKRYTEPQGPDTSGLPELPEGWCWTTVEQLTILSQNGTGKRRSEIGNPTIILRLADIVDGEAISLGDVRRIKLQDDEIEKYKLVEDDLLCIRVNGSPDLVGRVIHFTGSDEAIAFCDHFIRFRLVLAELANFLTMNSHTDRIRKYIELNKVSSAGQNTVSQTTMNAAILPLPPLAEQHRIVAEVERCLSVVTEVEAAVDANLARAERLRQAILKRAFEGRLVPQNPDDEPASALLERIGV